jgi:hypothetical protein
MKPATQPRAKARHALGDMLSRALLLLVALAFASQTYLVQTHIHMPASGKAASPDVLDYQAPPAGHGKAPAKDDPANCPLCQQFASAGQFVTPAAAATLLPSFSVSVIEFVVVAANLVPAASHFWQGRAPPHA